MIMRLVTIDTETHLIRPGLLVPRPVCVQIGEFRDRPPMPPVDRDGSDWSGWRDEAFGCVDARLIAVGAGVAALHTLLADPEVLLIGQNIAYDLAVLARVDPTLLPKVFAAYEAGRIEDIKIREKLLLLSIGRLADEGESGNKLQEKFDLAAIVDRHFHVSIAEDKHGLSSWRLRYGELEDVPLEDWPSEARRYALDDVRWNLVVFLAQWATRRGNVPDSASQARHAWWMHLMGAWGVRTHPDAVFALEAKLRRQMERMDRVVRDAGLLQARRVKGEVVESKDLAVLRRMIGLEYDGNPPMTDGRVNRATGERVPEVSTSRETKLARVNEAVMDRYDDEIDAGVPVEVARANAAQAARVSVERIARWEALRASVERDQTEKLLSTYVPTLLEGTKRNITPNWNPLVASGRVSCLNPNLTNQPRKGGVRECYAPREGWLYAVADYSFIELVTLAQTCLDRYGESRLAEAINAGMDPHLGMAASMLKISYAEAKRRSDEPQIKAARQAAKAYNFGFPGGLGPAKMVDYARIAYGIEMSLEEAKQRREDWYAQWPEMRRYHQDIGKACENAERETTVVQDVSGRVRGGCSFTAAANSYFQGRTADGAKRSGWYLARECYLDDPYADDGKHAAMGLRVEAGRRTPSPLYGCRTVAFVHDEFIVEVPASVAPQAAKRLSEVMVLGMREYVPSVKIGVETVLVERWYKGAKPVHDANGNLAVWRP